MVRDRGWAPSTGKEFATLIIAHPQSGPGMWLVRYDDGRQDTVHERRFTLDVAVGGVTA